MTTLTATPLHVLIRRWDLEPWELELLLAVLDDCLTAAPAGTRALLGPCRDAVLDELATSIT